ncbi:CDP-alcohol phosphatidyltransferase [Streptomyces mexicanus]|uniref:CDP-alcohol phosphatidyltransferase n=1 Tax=Streptomyces mexicanus TaxID=178566 RepID=UPI003B001C34
MSQQTSTRRSPDPAGTPRRALRLPRFLHPRTARRLRRAWHRRLAAHPQAARGLSGAVTVLAVALVVLALLLPNKREQFHAAAFLRIPVEALLGAVVLVALPRGPRTVVAALAGTALGALTVLNLADIEFNQYLGRSFDVVLDWPLLGDARSYLADTLGGTVALLAAVAAVLLVLALLAVPALAAVRVGTILGRHRTRATQGLLLACAVWMTCSSLNVRLDGIPVASGHTVTMLRYHAQALRSTLRDERAFARTARADAFGGTPGDQLLPDLRGKDMVFTFVESYGRSAIEDPVEAPGVDRTLDASTRALARAGFHAASGWLTSATYGGGSWLGHSTFMSGLWIDNQNRYRTVTSGDRLTLTEAFRRTGAWDTVGIMPGVQKGWPEAKWYGLEKVYDALRLGYRGPKFSWSTMPDQYALQAFQRLAHGGKHAKPLASFVILTSSHQPWAPIPKLVPWDELGDGSVFRGIEAAGTPPQEVIANATRSRQEYGRSIQYSVTALTQWLERYGTDDTVLVLLGDHQPIARVSGDHASRDVPVSIVAKDPKVLERISGWGWTAGLRPAHDAPVWPMSAFRDRFLTAYGSVPHPTKG